MCTRLTSETIEYTLAMVAITVILTDYHKAVLFTAYRHEDIEREIKEHFSNQRVEVFACDRRQVLDWWPADDVGGWLLKKHEVLCDRVFFPNYLRASMRRLTDEP